MGMTGNSVRSLLRGELHLPTFPLPPAPVFISFEKATSFMAHVMNRSCKRTLGNVLRNLTQCSSAAPFD